MPRVRAQPQERSTSTTPDVLAYAKAGLTTALLRFEPGTLQGHRVKL